MPHSLKARIHSGDSNAIPDLPVWFQHFSYHRHQNVGTTSSFALGFDGPSMLKASQSYSYGVLRQKPWIWSPSWARWGSGLVRLSGRVPRVLDIPPGQAFREGLLINYDIMITMPMPYLFGKYCCYWCFYNNTIPYQNK